jgi:hypothetical protein
VLAALVSLRVFKSEFFLDHKTSSDGYLLFIENISGRAPKLEYIGILNRGYKGLHCGKRVSGEWVLCDEEEFSEAWADQPKAIYS